MIQRLHAIKADLFDLHQSDNLLRCVKFLDLGDI